jgi:hypothetical protein
MFVRGLVAARRRVLSSEGTAAGNLAFRRASAAETCGAAIDVPFSKA